MGSWRKSLTAVLAGVGLASFAASGAQAENTIIVLDASGSMWAQIDGSHKITIAREVLDEVLGQLPAEQSLGFMAYGHRQKGVCSDIELLVAPKVGAGEEIRQAAAKLNPKGKTPLSDAVRQAAEALRYTEEKATVVLITDGLETCDADPCALGRALEESGIGFTAHVVGFGLKEGEGAQIACLAEETGGRYLDAANAAELTSALTETVAAVPEPEPEPEAEPEPLPSATLAAPAEVPAGSDFEVAWEGPDDKGDYVTIVEVGTPEQRHGNYGYTRTGNPLPVKAPDGLGAYELRYVSGSGGQTLGRRAITLTPIEASVEAPFEVAAGARFEVTWTGPGYNDDYLTIVEAGAPEGSHGDYRYARDGSPATLAAPDGLGSYEVRYVVGQSKRTLASQPVILVAVGATLEAPAEVPAGSAFNVAWEGPDNANDYITIVEVGAPEGTHNDYDYTRKGSPADLVAPDGLGAYEIRYVMGKSKRTLASRPVTLVAVGATLEAPAEVPAGASFEVTWEGPDNPNDYITIVEAGAPEGTYNDYDYTRKGSPADLVAPDGLGAYEIRYVMGKSKRTLASRPVTLVAVGAKLEVPAEVPAGSSFEVTWEGPNNPNDYIAIAESGAPEGKYLNYAYARKGSPAKLLAPESLGSYEVRYVMGKSKRTLVSQPLTLVAVSATLEAPAEVAAGSDFQVNWTGPNNPNDYIAIAEPGAPEGKYLAYAYARKGSPAKLRAPDMVGRVEIRYVMGKSKRTLVSETIELTPVSASLTVANTVVPEGKAIVEWQGPNLANDYIALAEPGAPEGKYLAYAYTRKGNPATIKVPKVLGNFEIRYVIGQSKRTLASIPVLIDIAQVSLEAPASVKAGSTLKVAWTGPANWEDFIEIVPAGAPPKSKPVSATRTSQGSPLPIFAPGQPGQYEIRYVMRDTGEVAAARPLTVE
ncbi:MAG: VWA domain-containing protein [Kiloniellales bacterium]